MAAILVTSLAAAAHAADSSLEPATELLAECPKAADPNYNEACTHPIDMYLVALALMGMKQGSNTGVCLPEGVPDFLVKARSALLGWIREHPDAQSGTAGDALLAAAKGIYPCH